MDDGLNGSAPTESCQQKDSKTIQTGEQLFNALATSTDADAQRSLSAFMRQIALIKKKSNNIIFYDINKAAVPKWRQETRVGEMNINIIF